MTDETPTVLVVDDERDLADLYAAWLEGDYDVVTVYGGAAAIEAVDEGLDVALIDRLMPSVTGDEVLEHIRSEGYDCRVAMVTAVEPDFDIIEMGFDEYIVKPIREDGIRELVASLVTRSRYDDQLQEFFSLASKRAALQAQKPTRELRDSQAFAELTEELESMRSELERTTDDLSVRDLEVEMRKLNADGSI